MDITRETRRKLYMEKEQVTDTSSFYYGRYFLNYDGKVLWSLQQFNEGFKIKIVRMSETEMEFDMIGIDSGLVNTFRRLLLSEVPSMAFEKVGVYNNTSIIPDEVLAHRLGLIPLAADPKLFSWRPEGQEGTETDTLNFELKVKCSWNLKRPKNSSDPDDMYLNHKVYSRDIKWVPVGAQKDLFTADSVGPLYPDILIAKLRPGHEIDLKLEAVKGIGSDHAKFCPVATAYYRLLPEIKMHRTFTGEDAERVQKSFSPGVIAVEEKKGVKTARLVDARYDSCSRNILRHEDLGPYFELSRIKDHHIFTIESCTGRTPDELFLESIQVLKDKAKFFLAELIKNHMQ